MLEVHNTGLNTLLLNMPLISIDALILTTYMAWANLFLQITTFCLLMYL